MSWPACGDDGVQAEGCQLVRHVELRGRRDCLAEVLLVSRAVLQLSTTATRTIDPPHISTPSQLTKNMITNASFRSDTRRVSSYLTANFQNQKNGGGHPPRGE